MDSRAVRKRIRADHRLIRRHRNAQQVGDQAAGAIQLARVDVGVHAEVIGAGAQRHHDFFERRVPGPFADAVDGAFHLPGAVQHAGQRIGHGHAEIVMAVHADGRPLDAAARSRECRGSAQPYCSGTV